MLNKKINQFSGDTAIQGTELILIMDSGTTKNMVVDNLKKYVLSGTTDVFVTGGTYSNSIITFRNNTGGTFSVSGISSSSNISDSIYTVNTGLSANTTTTATTSVMIYGVNVFTAVTATNFATKLPQPVTGKSVKVINNGSSLLHIFPSNIGGKINNLPINTPAVIPADGKVYEFICVENPLPGAWTYSPPATAQFDSGEISISISAGTRSGGYNPVIVAYDATHVGEASTFYTANWGYNGKNSSFLVTNTYLGKYYARFRPVTPWLGISKIKVYTNLVDTSADTTVVRLMGAGESDYYSLFDGSILNNGPSDSGELFWFSLDKTISGAIVTGSTISTSANIGDAGTVWGEKVANSDLYYTNVTLDNDGGTFIGGKTIGTIPYPYSNTSDNSGNDINTGDNVEKYYTSYISFQINPFGDNYNFGVIPDFKFRFIIEYYQ